jgi:translocation protein SEC62
MQNPNAGPGGPGGPGPGGPIPVGPGGMPMGPNGMPMPTPQQIQAMQAQLAAEAEKHGMTVPQFVEHIKAQRMAQIQQMQQQQQAGQGGPPGGPQGGPQGQGRPGPPPGMRPGQPQPQPIMPGPPNPVAIALANFLRSQSLKPRTVIMNGERKDMFRGMFLARSTNSFEASRANTVNSQASSSRY